MQTPTELPPFLRVTIDYIFIFKDNNNDSRERIYKNYVDIFGTIKIFNRILDECTKDYHCLVIDNTTHSNKLEDRVFIYKAKNHEEFKICSDNIWNINDQNSKDICMDENNSNLTLQNTREEKKQWHWFQWW